MDKEKYILECAKELFSEIGYKGTTMDLLASKCDMGKGTLYLYYNSKEDVLKSIIDDLLETIKNSMIEIEGSNKAFNEQIMMMLKEILKLRNEQLLISKFVFEAKQMGNQTVNKYVEQIDEYIINMLKVRIDNAIKNNYIKECNSSFMAYLVYKIYMILIFDFEQKNNTKLDEKEIYKLLENLFK